MLTSSISEAQEDFYQNFGAKTEITQHNASQQNAVL
jgi:hypothetical protein